VTEQTRRKWTDVSKRSLRVQRERKYKEGPKAQAILRRLQRGHRREPTHAAMDRVSSETRSRIMASVRSRDTMPEINVRKALHSAGLRYRLHDNRLPGKPDIVFASRKLAIFVHGCFWHRCPHCKNGAKSVGSNEGYWVPKLARNAVHDQESRAKLRNLGWRVRVIWECQAKNPRKLARIVSAIKSME
jgi:DNA mismatch endonuclease (patch repair protein)